MTLILIMKSATRRRRQDADAPRPGALSPGSPAPPGSGRTRTSRRRLVQRHQYAKGVWIGNRAVRRSRAASRSVRSTKSSSPAGLAYTAGLPKWPRLLYCSARGLSITSRHPAASRLVSGAPAGPPRAGARGSMIPAAPGRARGSRDGGDGAGPKPQAAERGLPHDVRRGVLSREQDELRRRLLHEHLDPSRDLEAARPSLADQPGLRWVVDDVVDPGGIDPGDRQRDAID